MNNTFLLANDVTVVLSAIVFVALFGFIVCRLIVFVPDLMVSLIKKVKNKSIIYSDNTLDKTNLDTNLDKSEFGMKNLLDRWF